MHNVSRGVLSCATSALIAAAVPAWGTELLVNGNFDAGPGAPWFEQSLYELIYSSVELPQVPPQSGAYAVWLGGTVSSTDRLWQAVDVPLWTTTLQVSGYRRILNYGTGAYDFSRLEICAPDSTVLELLAQWRSDDWTNGWAYFTVRPAGVYGGRTIMLRLSAVNDHILPTDFFFDTMSLQATGTSVGWCDLQSPSTLTTTAGVATGWVLGRVRMDGMANQPGATPGLTAELGYGPHGSDPSVHPETWQWVPAAFNLDVGLDDEYKATLTPATPGEYDYCYRYSYSFSPPGLGWSYGDLNGSLDGYSADQAGALTVTSAGAVQEELPAKLSFVLQGTNPMVGSARFRFGLPRQTRVELAIHDVTGRRLATLAEGELGVGYHTVNWERAGAVVAGAYFARLRADGQSFTRRLVVLR